MRRRYGQLLRVGVAADSVSLRRCGGWRGDSVPPVECTVLPGGDGFAAHAEALRALLGERTYAGWPLEVVLDDTLARLWQVTPPPTAGALADLEAAAALRFERLYGQSPAAWQLTAQWDARDPFVAAAAPRALLAVLQRAAAEQGLFVIGITPHVVAVWNRWRRRLKAGAWFCLVHGQTITFAVMHAGRLSAVRAVPLPSAAGHDWLNATIAREALLLDVPAPTLLQLAGALPPAWRQRSDDPAHIACQALDGQGAASLSAACQLVAGSRA